MPEEKKSKKTLIIIIVLIIVVGGGIGLYFAFFSGGEKNVNTVSNTTTANTNAEVDPYADLMKYDGVIYKVTSSGGRVDGRVGIKIDKTWEYPIHVAYFFKIVDDLPKKSTDYFGESYNYIGSYCTEETMREGDGTGSVSPIFCNTDTMVDVLELTSDLSSGTDVYLGCDDQLDPWHSTDTFTHSFNHYYNNETFDFDELMSNDKLVVYDTTPFYYEEVIEGVTGYNFDDEQVISEGEVQASYDLEYTEI